MALQIIVKKRFTNSLKKVTSYLKTAFGKQVAKEFYDIVTKKIILLSVNPNLGAQTGIKDIRCVLAGKGFQNKIYYRVKNNDLIIINMIDTRRNPKKNPFNKSK